MKLTGIADEAGSNLKTQIEATRELGWNSIELRFLEIGGCPNGSIHEIPEEAFEKAAAMLEKSGIGVSGIGSTIGNWAHPIDDPFRITEGEVRRCIDRMNRLNTKIVRIMSYAIRKSEDGADLPDQMAGERFRRVREIQERFAAADKVVVHENCMNYGGMGPGYAAELIAAVPEMKWVFDTGNPVFNRDRNKPEPHPMQDAWEMYEIIKPHIAHIHVKDGIWHEKENRCEFTFPGKGDGQVERILRDLKESGYTGYVSIEPHVASVFHEEDEQNPTDPEAKAKEQYESYVNYGRALENLITGL